MLDSRSTSAGAFCAATGWGEARRSFLAGDASARRYERLARTGGATAVLMDAPPGSGEDLGAFLRIARHLRDLGLSAPAVLAADPEAGFLLLEDLGDGLFARLLAADPGREAELYAAAADVLLRVQAAPPPPGLPIYDAAAMAEAVAPAITHYRAALTGEHDDPAPLTAAMRGALDALPPAPPVMILRDYHAENLLWLPGRSGIARVGLLDFQLAMVSHPAYDLVSLLQDARRDIAPGVEAATLARFAAATGAPPETLAAAYRAIGAQRHLRILGIFARLATDQGKTAYIDYIPRIWRDLWRDLADPALAPLAEAASALLPAPDPESLERLKTRCPPPTR